jgi:hypothetical protein
MAFLTVEQRNPMAAPRPGDQVSDQEALGPRLALTMTYGRLRFAGKQERYTELLC